MGQVESNNIREDLKYSCSFPVHNKEDVKNLFFRIFSEFFGTAMFIFLACMACVEGMGDGKTGLHAALPFGVAAFVACLIFSRRGGVHINPALSLMSIFFKQLTFPTALICIAAQCVGAICGYALLQVISPERFMNTGSYLGKGMCTTVPHKDLSLAQTISVEFLLSLYLGLIVCSLWDVRNPEPGAGNVPFALGLYMLVYVGAGYTGASMNPARSLAPAIWNNTWENHWVYWLSPILGCSIAGLFYTLYFGRASFEKEEG